MNLRLRKARPLSDPGQGRLDASRPLGVYVHFPFCSVRCPYCDFAVDTRVDIPHDRYADAVIAEIAARAPWFHGDGAAPTLRSIYFGGGTPGLWRPAALARVIEAVRRGFGAVGSGASPIEITVEANPGEVGREHLSALRAAGVNRLSLGVQSLDDGHLRVLGRNHDAAAGPRAMADARAAGFDNISCDLIFGVPGQSLDDWRRSLDGLIALSPDHVSAYSLTVEKGTPYFTQERAGTLGRPVDEEVATMFQVGIDTLAAAGFQHYEVSSHARPGRRAVHNGLYWSGGSYLGVGVGAASFRPLADGRALRFKNARSTDTYLRGVEDGGGHVAPVEVEERSKDDVENESLWLALRTADGVDRRAHAARCGRDPLDGDDRAREAQRCIAAGWLEATPETLRLTRSGFLFADEVAARLWR